MYQPVINFSYLTEIKITNVPAANQVYPFVDYPQLRLNMQSVKVRGLGCFTETQLLKSPNGNTLVSQVTGMVLTLQVSDSSQDVFMIPCIDLVSGSNSGLIRMFRDKQINFTKSYITILDATALSQNESVCFNVIYEK